MADQQHWIMAGLHCESYDDTCHLRYTEESRKQTIVLLNSFNPLAAKLFNLNFHPLEIVSRRRDPQLQVSKNYSDLTK